MKTSFTSIIGILKQDMLQRVNDMDVLSNNLANANTAGFKASRSNFQELLDNSERGGGIIGSTQVLTKQGPIATTNWGLDLAIIGEGYFAVRLPDGGTAYTRDGRFNLDSKGNLVNASGLQVVWDGTIPEGVTDVIINDDGEVGHFVKDTSVVTNRVWENDQWVEKPEMTTVVEDGKKVEKEVTKDVTTWEKLGTIQLYRFTNPGGLKSRGENLWLESENSGKAVAGTAGITPNYGHIQTKAYEGANVTMSDEMAHLISLQRGMQVSIRTLQQTDRMIEQAINLRR